jgi:hypothetical protein
MSVGELEVGRVLSKLFHRHVFQNRTRPAWLVNDFPGRVSRVRAMELDYYCPELKLAVEYHGRQHHALVPFFHGHGDTGRAKLEAQQLRDRRKLDKCREMGVDLIVVWYWTPVERIEDFLRRHHFVVNRLSEYDRRTD